jgi:GntR family transcriptional regulator, transcriptional repressor for pyruvate dehydrogenase complex
VNRDLPFLFTPLKTKRRFEEISSKIKELIFKGVLKPGDRLPSETELARQFSVGRQSIREALRLLELSGFITIQQGGSGGPIIENTILNTLSNSFLDAIKVSNTSIRELTQARIKIETLILKETIQHQSASDLTALQENIIMAKKKIAEGRQAFRENIAFHKLLAKASKNQVFVIVVEAIMAVVANFLSNRGEPTIEESSNVTKSHEAILDAIKRKKTKEAISLLESHLSAVETFFPENTK